MPTTVTSSAGTVYHLWQLHVLATPEPSESIAFNTLRNDLANGYSSQVLFGSNTGLRTWRLKLPTLAALEVLPNTVTGINGEAVSREQYVWDLYCESMVTGEPFVYQSQRNGQYYLVEFADEEMTYEMARVKLYSTGITLRQKRVSGETIFDIGVFEENPPTIMAWLKGPDFATPSWPAGIDHLSVAHGAATFGKTGDVVTVAAGQNGLNTVRFNNTANTGHVNGIVGSGYLVNEVFIVMKMREATFSNNAGIFTAEASGPEVLTGESGTTKFTNPGLSAATFTYRKNSVEYAQSNMQAPMNEWGVVHVRLTTGYNFMSNEYQFGQNLTTAGTFAEMDVGEILIVSGTLSTATEREITEYLTVKWGIT